MFTYLKNLKLSTLGWVGLLIALFIPFSSLVSFALIATIIGEQKLEGPDGLTSLGTFSLWLPVALGFVLVAIDLTFKPKLKKMWQILVAGGVTLAAVGLFGLFYSGSEDANIGAGILVMAGAMAAGLSLAIKPAKK